MEIQGRPWSTSSYRIEYGIIFGQTSAGTKFGVRESDDVIRTIFGKPRLLRSKQRVRIVLDFESDFITVQFQLQNSESKEFEPYWKFEIRKMLGTMLFPYVSFYKIGNSATIVSA